MFFVYNKDKIISVVIALSTVLVLFLLAATFKQNTVGSTVETSAGTSKLLPIYSVDTKENKVALTINCAWNADDIDLILKTLSENEAKATFFMVGEWVSKFPDAVKIILPLSNFGSILSHICSPVRPL